MPDRSAEALARVVREEWGKVVATLVRELRDLDLAEDAVQDAAVAAMTAWPTSGIPDRPGAWLLVAARRRALDRLRRAQVHDEKLALMGIPDQPDEPDMDFDEQAIHDDQLALIFGCCHPALAIEAQVALTLRSLCGLTTHEVARAFLVPETTMAQRLVRAKRKIKLAGVPFTVPDGHLLLERTAAALAVVYLVFNEGYSATAGDTLIRHELIDESLRLARLLRDLLPDDPEVLGLLALMLLTDARRRARTDDDGELVPLEDQDRARWDRAKIDEGMAVLAAAARRERIGPYQLQAAIAAVHDRAARPSDVDWRAIVALYGVLNELRPSPVVELNRAVAVGMASSPDRGLAQLDALESVLGDHHLFHAARADLLRRAGRGDDACAAFTRALHLAPTGAERRYLERRLASLSSRG